MISFSFNIFCLFYSSFNFNPFKIVYFPNRLTINSLILLILWVHYIYSYFIYLFYSSWLTFLFTIKCCWMFVDRIYFGLFEKIRIFYCLLAFIWLSIIAIFLFYRLFERILDAPIFSYSFNIDICWFFFKLLNWAVEKLLMGKWSAKSLFGC